MAQNTGTLITAAIRPNDDRDPIASAFSSEIKGGLHTKQTLSERDGIIEERRDWGMLCYVINEDTTYQLIYNKVNTDINDNNNWDIFTGDNTDSNSQWLDSVLSVITTPPTTPTVGDRYLGGLNNGDSLTGIWDTKRPGLVFEWDSANWVETIPNNGSSIRVNNEKNVVYRYDGVYPNGKWIKENLNQVLEVNANSTDGITYTSTTETNYDEYVKNAILLTSFDVDNTGTQLTLNINGIGSVNIKKPTQNGLIDLIPGDVKSGVVYTLIYDGLYFQLVKHYSDDSLKLKNKITVEDYVVVPPNHQYWIYGDLEIEGTLINYGEVIISNGSMVIIGNGNFEDYGKLNLISLIDSLSINFNTTDTIKVTEEQTLEGMSYSFNIADTSIDTTKLDTGAFGGAVNGYVLSAENNQFKWVPKPLDGKNGIESANSIYQLTPTLATNGDNSYTGIDIANTPNAITSIRIIVNGQLQILGDGDNTKQFYFTNDGVTPLPFENITKGSKLYYNGVISGYDLTPNDTVLILYEI